MAIRDPERGQRRPWSYRNGMGDFPGWRGIRRQGDQASIPANQFWNAENVRLRGGNVISRYGQTKVNTDSIGQVDSIFDNNDDSGLYRLIYAGKWGGLDAYDKEQNPNEQDLTVGLSPTLVCNYDSASSSPRRVLHPFGGRLLVFNGTYVQIVNLVYDGTVSVGFERLFTASNLSQAVQYQSKLWFGSTTGGNVTYWDGQSYRTDVSGLGAGRIILARHFESLLAFGTHYAKLRSNAGAWTAITMPGGITSFNPLCWAAYKNVLYVGGVDLAAPNYALIVLSYDGTSLVVARNAGSGLTSGAIDHGVSDLVVFNGFLYYAHQRTEGGASAFCRLGRFDGSTWTDAHKVFSTSTPIKTVGALVPYRGSLFAALGDNPGGNRQLWESPGTNTAGTWTKRTEMSRATADIVAISGGGRTQRLPVPVPNLTSGTWLHVDDADQQRSLISDRTLPYIYAVQSRNNGNGTFTVRVKRFGRQVAGEPNIVFVTTAINPSTYYFIGVTSGTVVTRTNQYLLDNGEIISGFNVTATTLTVKAYWANNGVIRVLLSPNSSANAHFYKFVGSPVPTLEAQVTPVVAIYPMQYFTQGAETLLHATKDGLDTSFDYPIFSQNRPFPAFTDYFLSRWQTFRQEIGFPTVQFSGSHFFAIEDAGGAPQNVGFLELSSALTYTKRMYTTTGVYSSIRTAWLFGGAGYLLADLIAAGNDNVLRFTGGLWTVLGATTGMSNSTVIGPAFVSGSEVFGIVPIAGTVFLYKASSPNFTAWSQVGTFSQPQGNMRTSWMAWIL